MGRSLDGAGLGAAVQERRRERDRPVRCRRRLAGRSGNARPPPVHGLAVVALRGVAAWLHAFAELPALPAAVRGGTSPEPLPAGVERPVVDILLAIIRERNHRLTIGIPSTSGLRGSGHLVGIRGCKRVVAEHVQMSCRSRENLRAPVSTVWDNPAIWMERACLPAVLNQRQRTLRFADPS